MHLNPCPNCGATSPALFDEDGARFLYTCRACDFSPPEGHVTSKKRALGSWNSFGEGYRRLIEYTMLRVWRASVGDPATTAKNPRFSSRRKLRVACEWLGLICAGTATGMLLTGDMLPAILVFVLSTNLYLVNLKLSI